MNKLTPQCQCVLREFLTLHKMKIIETLRTPERQAELVKAGKSKTLKSRHLTGNAVDMAPLPMLYKATREHWHKLHDDWDAICKKQGVKPEKRIEWDLNHFGLIS